MKTATKTGARVMVVEKDRHTGRRRTVGYGAVATVAVPAEAMGLVVGKVGYDLQPVRTASSETQCEVRVGALTCRSSTSRAAPASPR